MTINHKNGYNLKIDYYILFMKFCNCKITFLKFTNGKSAYLT